jgi:dimethylargininase
MRIALTRTPSPQLADCHLTYIDRQPIDYVTALAQHQQYEFALRQLGVHIAQLPETPELPDGAFVEDIAAVVDGLGIIAPMAVSSRMKERGLLECVLSAYELMPLYLDAAATLDGGDVLRVGDEVFVGLSGRTNEAAVEDLRRVLEPDVCVTPVAVRGCLHLRSGCSYLGRNTFLINRRCVDPAAFTGRQLIDVAVDEPSGANALRIGDTILMSESCPGTVEAVVRAGFRVVTVDISEFEKAEGGVTGLSLGVMS